MTRRLFQRSASRTAPAGVAAILVTLALTIAQKGSLIGSILGFEPPVLSRPAPHAALRLASEQMEALKKGDVSQCFEHTTPKTRAAVGSAAGLERILRESNELSPLIGFSQWQLLGSLRLSETSYVVRVRVMPAWASSSPHSALEGKPIDYTWYFRLHGSSPEESTWKIEEIMPDLDVPPL